MGIKERIKALCDEQGIKAKDLESELGFGKGYISKIDNTKPNSAYIEKLAIRLNTTTDYILNGVQPEIPTFSDAHLELIELYEKLSDEKKKLALEVLKAFI